MLFGEIAFKKIIAIINFIISTIIIITIKIILSESDGFSTCVISISKRRLADFTLLFYQYSIGDLSVSYCCSIGFQSVSYRIDVLSFCHR